MAQPFNEVYERTPHKAGEPVPQDIRAAILTEAAWAGDLVTCEKYGIVQRTLQRWRRAITYDDALAEAIAEKKKAFEKRWLDDLDLSLGQAVRAVGACARAVEADPKACKNPAIIHELAVAVRLLADVKMASKVIDARLEVMRQNQLPPASNGHNGEEERNPPRLMPGEVEIAPGVFVLSPASAALEESEED